MSIGDAVIKMAAEHNAACGVWTDNYAFAYGPNMAYCTHLKGCPSASEADKVL